jgi:hypothetical protein
MASRLYANFLKKGYDSSTKINLASGGDTIKVALVTSSYTPDFDAHDFFDDVTNEISGTGYTTGGATLAGQDITVVGASDVVKFDANDTSWTVATFTARAAVIYKSTGAAGTSPLIGYVDFGADRVVDGGTFQITWNASGIFTISY